MHFEQYYAPFISFINTEYGLVQVGIKVPPSAYAALNSENHGVWKEFLRLIHDQVEENLSELSQGEYPQD